MADTLELKSAGPILTVNDLQASVAFYRHALGFAVGRSGRTAASCAVSRWSPAAWPSG
jgi:hypothetical protein